MPNRPFTSMLTDGSTMHVTGDYSSAPHEFYSGPPTGESWYIRHINIVWQGAAGENDLNRYLVGGAALSTGLRLVISDDTTELSSMCCNATIKRLSDWVLMGFVPVFDGDFCHLTLDVIDTFGVAIELNGSANQVITIIANDDFTAGGTLIHHSVSIVGRKDKLQW